MATSKLRRKVSAATKLRQAQAAFRRADAAHEAAVAAQDSIYVESKRARATWEKRAQAVLGIRRAEVAVKEEAEVKAREAEVKAREAEVRREQPRPRRTRSSGRSIVAGVLAGMGFGRRPKRRTLRRAA